MPPVTVRELGGFATAVINLTAGLTTLTLAIFRRRSIDRMLLWFGAFAAIYGIRQFAKEQLVPAAFRVPPYVTIHIIAWLDFLIAVPVMLFNEEILGKEWRPLVRPAAWIMAVYAALGIVLSLVWDRPYPIPEPAAYLLWLVWLGVIVLGAVKRYRPPSIPDARLFVAGAAVFLAFVMIEHLAPMRYHAEPLGFFVFICCLGIIAVRRTVHNEQRLFAIEQEMASARRIQYSILPAREPAVASLKIAARYSPMASVAGDFYDFVTLDSHRVGILVADVAGHGVPAALIASMVKVAFRSQQAHANDPSSVLSGLNRIFCEQGTGQFITAGYLMVDGLRRSAVYAGAAHPPLILLRKTDGGVRRFEKNGIFLGFRSSEAYSNIEIPLTPGDRLLLYTDGLLEAVNESGEAFENRIDDRIRGKAYLPPREFADALLRELAEWSAPNGRYMQHDDLTLLVVDVDSGRAS